MSRMVYCYASCIHSSFYKYSHYIMRKSTRLHRSSLFFPTRLHRAHNLLVLANPEDAAESSDRVVVVGSSSVVSISIVLVTVDGSGVVTYLINMYTDIGDKMETHRYRFRWQNRFQNH